ncbi:phosphatase PAP2 family protein [Hominiventricola filiformis]|uniref:Phosphatase PAP2 family protein n=1 Tax=Hominiventricola filiformis TaxID=2885352 RepID=A0AAE3DA04_9FIRM|nr:phosphatase PAP2 family protein [Hominiventricola filiformis]MCC2124595.1 phosphatase PAP2 family protein [Hominiventricola filiformis]
MKELIKKRHLIPIAVWFVIYMGLFGFLEIVPPKDVHLIHCALDDRIPNMAIFIYPYVSWFPYIVVCAALAIKNLDDRQFKKAVLVLTTGMNIFLFISYVWPTGLDFRESIVYDLHTLSGNLLKFVQTADTPKSVFPSMHVYVTLVLQYTLEMQKKLVPAWGIWVGRVLALLIVLSTMFTKQHSAVDVTAAIVMFAVLALAAEKLVKEPKEEN